MAHKLYHGCNEVFGEGDTIQAQEAAKLEILDQMEACGCYVCEPKRDGTWAAMTIRKDEVIIELRSGRRMNQLFPPQARRHPQQDCPSWAAGAHLCD